MFHVPDVPTIVILVIMWAAIANMVWQGVKFKRQIRAIREQRYRSVMKIIADTNTPQAAVLRQRLGYLVD